MSSNNPIVIHNVWCLFLPFFIPWLYTLRIIAMAEGLRVVVLSAASLLQAGYPNWADSSRCIWSLPKSWYPNSWMFYFMENPILEWMIWGYSYFEKPPYEPCSKVFNWTVCFYDYIVFFFAGEMLIYRFHTWGKAAVNSNISNWFSEFQSPNVAFLLS